MGRVYESMMIVRPDVSSEEREEIFQKITKRIEGLQGKVIDAKIWVKERPLQFILRSRGAEKKKYTKGCYWLVHFTLDTEQLPVLKETLRLEERILRSLILKREERSPVESAAEER